MSEMQRTGRVGGNVFEQDRLALMCVAAAKTIAFAQHVANDLSLGILSEANVDKARPRNFDALDQAVCIGVCTKRRSDAFADRAGILLQASCKLQRTRAGDIAMRRIFRALEDDFRVGDVERLEGFREECLQSFFLLSEHIGKR